MNDFLFIVQFFGEMILFLVLAALIGHFLNLNKYLEDRENFMHGNKKNRRKYI